MSAPAGGRVGALANGVICEGGRGPVRSKKRTHVHQYLADRAVCTWGRSYCLVPRL
jgi:hypothetical protein